eukprot:1158915-Pelagomonas_calceolata.AAC.2
MGGGARSSAPRNTAILTEQIRESMGGSVCNSAQMSATAHIVQVQRSDQHNCNCNCNTNRADP